MLGAVFALVLQAFSNLLAQRVHGFKLAQRLGEIVIQRRQFLLLDGLDGDVVCDGLASQALVGKIRGVIHVEAALIAGRGPAQILRKFPHRVFAADFD